MEATALCTRLWMSMLLLLVGVEIYDAQEVDGSVILEGPLGPVTEGDSVTLHCRKKKTSSNYTADFYKDNMFIRSSDDGTMIIHSVSKSDAGPYKCLISGVGESQKNWLFVVDGVILDGPVHPVKEGDSVTLHCRNSKDPSKPVADFYRYGICIHTSYNGEMTIPRVSKADEGSYKCGISGFGESAESWLVVQGNNNLPAQENLENSSTSGRSHYSFLLTAIIASSVVVPLLVVGIGCFIAKRAKSHSLTAESASREEGTVVEPQNLTYSVITKFQRRQGQERSRGSQGDNPPLRENDIVYSTVNVNTTTRTAGH